MNFKSVLTKTFMAAGIAATGLTVANMNTNKAQAAVTSQDPSVVTIKAASVVVRRSASDYAATNGQVLNRATSWKVIDATNDAYGQRWYDLGKNQWVKASDTVAGYHTVAAYSASTSTNTTNTSSVATTSNNSYNYNNNSNSYSSYSYSTPKSNYTSVTTTVTSTSSYTSTASGSEAAAKAWIANRESGGSYSATNGQYIGKYQLSAAYLNGDYSAANQERVADNYVKSRYGSWSAAKSFWLANGWY
ncbi:hypothetical protein [Lactobacillus colini]|uniref:aggregation-promoting factor n=1 Tax=Lactobacillus colini TaxID=1819254 RepID=UPI001AE18E2F